MTDAALEKFKGCQNLGALDLSDTPVTDAGLVHLIRLGGLTDLRLVRTNVTAKGVARLAKALPGEVHNLSALLGEWSRPEEPFGMGYTRPPFED